MQGSIRRKTILKEGRKPTVASWQRYWIQIWSSSLAYFSPKSFKGYYFQDCLYYKIIITLFYYRNQRSDFKSEPCKLVSLTGCAIMLLEEESLQSDVFQIVDYHRSMHQNSYCINYIV